MLSIRNLIEKILFEVSNVGKKVFVHIVDRSGSTCSQFKEQNVLEKEMQEVEKNILSNHKDEHHLISFDNSATNHGIKVPMDETFVMLDKLTPCGGTSTSTGLQEALNLNKRLDFVKIYTDGDTCDYQSKIENLMGKLKNKGANIEIIAVAPNDLDFNVVSQNEERRIPGMDLLEYSKNYIDSLLIYNRRHSDIPFKGAISSINERGKMSLMGVSIPKETIIPDFLYNLLQLIKTESVDWGDNFIDLKMFCSQIGVLISSIFVTFPENHSFITSFSTVISSKTSFTKEQITSFFEYGFRCSKTKSPIKLTNFSDKVKECFVKRGEFRDAVSLLSSSGTTLNSNKCISPMIESRGYCLIDEGNYIVKDKPLNNYPRSKDEHQNIYYDCDGICPQATRIAIREYYNDKNSPNIIFRILSQMSYLILKGYSLTCEYMEELRNLAIIQTSMEVMVSRGHYDGMGCYLQWKNGNNPNMHFSKNLDHTSLYEDNNINPFKLTQPLWWCLMMSLLDIFDEQLHIYEGALNALNIECTRDGFLKYFIERYSKRLVGDIQVYKVRPQQISVITHDKFEKEDKVFVYKDHNSPSGSVCSCNTYYTEEQIEYLKNKGCIWCKHIPTDECFERVIMQNSSEDLKEIVDKSKRLRILHEKEAPIEEQLEKKFSQEDKFVVKIRGIKGSGKSTAANILSTFLRNKNIRHDVVSFRNKRFHEKCKVVILEDNIEFEYDEYTVLDFFVNFDEQRVLEYEAWCLTNALNGNKDYSNVVKSFIGKVRDFRNDNSITGKKLFIDKNNDKMVTLNSVAKLNASYSQYLSERNLTEEVRLFFNNNFS